MGYIAEDRNEQPAPHRPYDFFITLCGQKPTLKLNPFIGYFHSLHCTVSLVFL